jgi:hypothetical protein
MNLDAKKKKLVAIGGCAVVAIVGAFALIGSEKSSPMVPPPSAKEALAAAQAKIASEHGTSQLPGKGPAPARAAAPAAPAPAGTSAKPVAASTVALVPAAPATSSRAETAALLKNPTSPPVVTPVALPTAGSDGSKVPAYVKHVDTPAQALMAPVAAVPHQAKTVAAIPVGDEDLVAAVAEVTKSTAQQSGAADGGGFTLQYEEWGMLSQRVAVAEQLSKLAKLKREIRDSGSSEEGYPPPVATPAAVMPPPSVTTTSLVAEAADDKPAGRDTDMVSVMMVAGQYLGVLRSGMTVRPGSVLSDGWSILSITSTGYTAGRGKQRKTVQIGS